jgi:hypothetical protein
VGTGEMEEGTGEMEWEEEPMVKQHRMVYGPMSELNLRSLLKLSEQVTYNISVYPKYELKLPLEARQYPLHWYQIPIQSYKDTNKIIINKVIPSTLSRDLMEWINTPFNLVGSLFSGSTGGKKQQYKRKTKRNKRKTKRNKRKTKRNKRKTKRNKRKTRKTKRNKRKTKINKRKTKRNKRKTKINKRKTKINKRKTKKN